MILSLESELRHQSCASDTKLLILLTGSEPHTIPWHHLSLIWSSTCGFLPQTHYWYREGRNCVYYRFSQMAQGLVWSSVSASDPGRIEEIMRVKRRWIQGNIQLLSFFPTQKVSWPQTHPNISTREQWWVGSPLRANEESRYQSGHVSQSLTDGRGWETVADKRQREKEKLSYPVHNVTHEMPCLLVWGRPAEEEGLPPVTRQSGQVGHLPTGNQHNPLGQSKLGELNWIRTSRWGQITLSV